MAVREHQGVGISEVRADGFTVYLKEKTLTDGMIENIVSEKDSLVRVGALPHFYVTCENGITQKIEDYMDAVNAKGVRLLPISVDRYQKYLDSMANATKSAPMVFLALNVDGKLETTADFVTYRPFSASAIRETLTTAVHLSDLQGLRL